MRSTATKSKFSAERSRRAVHAATRDLSAKRDFRGGKEPPRPPQPLPYPNTGKSTTLIAATSLLALFLLATSSASAATYLVNSTDDLPDADTLDGVCSATVTGACTLRAAIMQANKTSGPDTIIVPAGRYRITRVNYDDDALGGDLDITDAVSVQGAGADTTVIDGNGDVTKDRVFHIIGSGPQFAVALTGMTISGGKVPVEYSSSQVGGGIQSSIADLTLIDLHIENNAALLGGGIYVDGDGLSPDLKMYNVVVRNNAATNGDGGGAWLRDVSLKVSNTIVHGNTAQQEGGGLWAQECLVQVNRSTIDGNTAQTGGGISTDSAFGEIKDCEFFSNSAEVGGAVNHAGFYELTFERCSLHHNHADADGGAITTVTDLVLSATTLEANSAGGNGGGLSIPGLISPASLREVTIEGSTLGQNTALFGGGIYYRETNDPNAKHSLTVRNSTVAFNQVTRDGGGIYQSGVARINTINATIASNAVRRASLGNPTRGGGIFSAETSYVTAENTLIGDNYFTNGMTTTAPDDCYTEPTTSFHSNGYNLIETTTNCTISGTTFACILGQDPKLDTAGLAQNGGATKTVALLASSPGINGGNDAVALKIDQRAYLRPNRSDIGAYELGAQPFTIRITSITRPDSTHILVRGIGAPDARHTLHVSSRPEPSIGTAGHPMSDAAGVWEYSEITSNLTQRFYYATYP